MRPGAGDRTDGAGVALGVPDGSTLRWDDRDMADRLHDLLAEGREALRRGHAGDARHAFEAARE
jgi:hypothetical protein